MNNITTFSLELQKAKEKEKAKEKANFENRINLSVDDFAKKMSNQLSLLSSRNNINRITIKENTRGKYKKHSSPDDGYFIINKLA